MNTAVSINQATQQALEAGEGILRLAPTWVPRVYLQTNAHRFRPGARRTHTGPVDRA